jgi:metallophosphoesterase superfamily enzyme
MRAMTLAVLSDLHVGTGSRAQDLCPYVDEEVRDANYRRRFLDFLRKRNLRADFLVLPGDVSHKAQLNELQLAAEVVGEITAALKTTPEQCVFVPGNHDVDWSRLRQKTRPLSDTSRST